MKSKKIKILIIVMLAYFGLILAIWNNKTDLNTLGDEVKYSPVKVSIEEREILENIILK